ncbi:2-hydroxyacyl-CoA dehydratase subunit D [candidate division CSSED10-310 bacterium]|uniref:2-hydroxyacyl-CoA dehydratase subunit D n=1 Tax=candidate division CSSED10-310 bacterium TaxID=2855610 RepID=A0ABV6Z1V8_UNCC1
MLSGKIHTISVKMIYWLWNWFKISLFILRVGPFRALNRLKRYPWLRTLLKVNHLHWKLTQGRSGNYLKATSAVLSEVVSGVTLFLVETFKHEGDLVLHEDMIPPEILRAMGLRPFMAELLGILMPMIDPHAMEEYIDRCEAEGIPPDLCSLPKSTMGLSLAGHFPPVQAILASNLPCDGGMASYALLERIVNKPIYRLDIPYDFMSEQAADYFCGELENMISWLEKNTRGRMDWDLLQEICVGRNVMVEHEQDIWDMLRSKPAPMAGEPVWMSHLWSFNVHPGTPESVRLFRKIKKWTEQNLRRGIAALPQEKFRAILWNPPTIHCVDIFNWAERMYGISLIMDSMTYNRTPYIDTSSHQTMLRSLGQVIMQGPMARHTRGPAENYLSDIFFLHENFQLDMVWVAGHIGCKNTMALNSILREECRQRGIPLLIIEYDLTDPRVVSRQRIIDQINHFMESIMNADSPPAADIF